MKAFYPAKPPFPLLHVDTTWKFREMIAFRDREAKRLGLDLIVHINEQGVRDGITPFTHGCALYTDIMKTQALQAGARAHRLRCGLRRRAARRGEVARQGAHVLLPQRRARLGPEAPAARSSGISTTRSSSPARACACFRCRTGPSSTSGTTSISRTFRSCRSISPPSGRWSSAAACSSWSTTTACRSMPGETPEMRRVRFRTLGCYPLTGAIESNADDAARDHRGDGRGAHSERQGRVIDHDQAGSMEKKKQEGYF